MPLFIPSEGAIDSMDVPATVELATALLLNPLGDPNGTLVNGAAVAAGLDVGVMKGLILTARRCLDPDKEDQDQVTLDEAIALFARLGLDATGLGISDDTEEPLFFIVPIVDFYSANLPA
jgi:hypothetical protein